MYFKMSIGIDIILNNMLSFTLSLRPYSFQFDTTRILIPFVIILLNYKWIMMFVNGIRCGQEDT